MILGFTITITNISGFTLVSFLGKAHENHVRGKKVSKILGLCAFIFSVVLFTKILGLITTFTTLLNVIGDTSMGSPSIFPTHLW